MIAVVVELVLIFIGMWSRYLAAHPLGWTEEIAAISLSVITFLGGPVAVRRGRGMALTFFINRLRSPWKENVEAAGVWASLAFTTIALSTLPPFLARSMKLKTPVLGIPEVSGGLWLAIGYVLLTLYLIDTFRRFTRRQIATGAVICAGMAGLILAFRLLTQRDIIAWDPFVLLAIVFAAAFFAAAPIAIVLGLAAFAFILGGGTVPIATTPVAFQNGISSFILLAIPFFMLAGVLMDMGGMAGKLITMIAPLASRLPGGLLITQVIAVYVFSGVSGSKLADIAAIGSVMRRPLKEAGYDSAEATAVLAASAAMSETVPPSLPIIVLASVTSLSMGALFLAGIFPAALVGAFLVAGIIYRGRGGRYPRGAQGTFAQFLRSIPGAIPAIVLPLILVVGLVGGIGTATEVAAFAAVYAAIIAAALYGKLNKTELYRATAESATLAGITLLILSTATLMSQVITMDQIPQAVTAALQHAGGKATFLLLSVGGLVVLGSLLEGLPALLVFAPLLLPIATALGVNPLQYGIVLVVAMGIGAFAPPIGVGLYVACAIGETTVEKTMRPSLFYTAVLIAGLAVLTWIPAITLFFPHLFGLG